MGFRVQQVRELDPQIPLIPQQTMINPYFNQMMSRDDASHSRQLQMMDKIGELDARRAASEIDKSAAWTRGLDSLTRSALPAAQTISGMRIASRQADEAEKSGEVNRINTMENALRTRQQRELDQQFGAQERGAGLEATRASTKMTGTQTKGMETANDIAAINLKKAQDLQAFSQADAAQYGFQNAVPGETVSQYQMRMEAEGKIAEVQRVKAEAVKITKEAEFMPQRLELEKRQLNANIEASRSQAASARAQIEIAKQGSNREQQSHELRMIQEKTAIMEKELDDLNKGISSGVFGPVSPEQHAGMLRDKIVSFDKRFGLHPEFDSAISRTLAKGASDQKTAKATEITTALLDPTRKATIDTNISQAKLANAGAALVTNLTSMANKYESANRFWNPGDSKLAASEIQATLDSAAIQEPRFKAYADKFREINQGIWAAGATGFGNLFGDSPAKQTKSLIESISRAITNEIQSNKSVDPIAANILRNASSNLDNSGNIFFQMKLGQQPQVPVIPVQNQNPYAAFGGK